MSAQNIDYRYSLELTIYVFWAEITKLIYTSVIPFYYIKVGFKAVKII